MKNFFRLEVFKDNVTVFDKQVPTFMITQTVTQWTAPDLGYTIKITFDSGVEIHSDTWMAKPDLHFANKNNYLDVIREEKDIIINEIGTASQTPPQ